MSIACINPDWSILVSQEEIEAIDNKFDNKREKGEYVSYEDLLRHYGNRSYDKEGQKLKSILSGKFTPTILGLKNTNRNSKVGDVAVCYKNRIDYTISTLKKEKDFKDIEQFLEDGIYGNRDTWYIHIITDGGNIPLGPFKSVSQASNVKECIAQYRRGKSNTINPAKIVMKTNRIHPSIISLVSNIFPDQE